MASAFDAIFESLSGTVQQQFDGPFAAMQLSGDLDQFLFALVVEFDPLPGTRAETVHAARQVDQPVIVVGPQGIGRQDRFEFEAQLRPPRFLPPGQTFDMFTQQIASDPQQPRSDESRRIETGLRDVEPEEDFLGHVVGITVLQQPRPQVAVDRPLMLLDDSRKRSTVSPPELLNQRLIDGGQHGRGPEKQWRVNVTLTSLEQCDEAEDSPRISRGARMKKNRGGLKFLVIDLSVPSVKSVVALLALDCGLGSRGRESGAAGWYGPLQTERNRVAIACASVRPVDRVLIGL